MSDADATQARQDVVANVDEIIEHVINANMLSMPYEVYSELFDAVNGLGVEIENLQSENAKLREQVTQLQGDWESERDYADQMEAKEKQAVGENAKLRKYAESYAKAVEGEGCGWCPYDIDAVCDTETMPMRDGCKLYDELRELGIREEQ